MASSFLATIRHCKIVFLAEAKRLIAYRAQFWFELISSSVIEIIISIAVWKAVFASSGVDTLNGYSLSYMIVYLTTATFFGQATKGTGVGTFQREVYEGSLTKYLIFPLSVYSYKFGTFMPRSMFAVVQLFVGLIVIWLTGNWPETLNLNLSSILLGLVMLFLACLLNFFLIILVESISFWVDNVWTLSYALQVAVIFLSGKVIPLDFFPAWIASSIAYTPFPYLAYVPARIFLGSSTFSYCLTSFGITLLWIFIVFQASRYVMKKGLYQYTGVGQ